MRNPTYALCILLCAALLLVLAGCDISDPSPTISQDWFLYDTDGNEVCYLFPASHGGNVRVTADGRYALYFRNGVLIRYQIETGEERAFDLPFDQFYADFRPSYEVIYMHARIGDTWGIHRIDIETGETSVLPGLYSESEIQFSFAYQRDEIYYSVIEDSLYLLKRFDLSSALCETILTNTDGRYRYPAVAPDGNAIYYYLNAAEDSLKGVYRYDLATQSALRLNTTESYQQMTIGNNEQFLVWRDALVQLDAGHQPMNIESIGLDCQLMADLTNVVYEDHTGWLMKRDVLSGAERRITGSYIGYWVSQEGHLVTILRDTW